MIGNHYYKINPARPMFRHSRGWVIKKFVDEWVSIDTYGVMVLMRLTAR